METRDQDVKPGTRRQRWGTIQEYVDPCRTREFFTEAFYRQAVTHMERIRVRRMLRHVRDGRGWPTLANICSTRTTAGRSLPRLQL